MTATVFGCSSFLGRYVVNNLARTGSQVVCPFRCDELDVQHLKVMGVLGQVVLYPDFNLRDDEMLDHAISKSNVVVNLVGAWRETWNYSFHDVHVDLTRRIAEAVKRAGHVERYLHVSCLAASPDAPSERLRTKAEGDRIVRDLLPNATIFKTAHMVGIEDKFTNALAARGKRSPFVGLVDGGHNKIQPVYVRDVARALTDSLKTYDAVGQTYHVAGPEVLTYVAVEGECAPFCVVCAYSSMCMPIFFHTGFVNLRVWCLKPCASPTRPLSCHFPSPRLQARLSTMCKSGYVVGVF